MRIAIVSSMLHPKYGGPPSVVFSHAAALSSNNEVCIFGCANQGELSQINEKFENVWTALPRWPLRWMRAPGLAEAITKWEPDIIHSHDIWLHGLYASWKSAKSTGAVLVITPHGTFTAPWRYNTMIKLLYRRIFLNKIFRDVSSIQALCREEAEGCRNAGICCPVSVIPNGLPERQFFKIGDSRESQRKWPFIGSSRIALYLGRLWSEKGLDILIDAWFNSVNTQGWILIIAGPDYRNYGETIHNRIAELGLSGKVYLIGMIEGVLKDSLLARSSLFVLPSHGEGFSVAILEALAAGLPALISEKCNFSQLSEVGGGWVCKDTVNDLTSALDTVLSLSSSELRAVGVKGRYLAKTQFTLECIADRLVDMYTFEVEKMLCGLPKV